MEKGRLPSIGLALACLALSLCSRGVGSLAQERLKCGANCFCSNRNLKFNSEFFVVCNNTRNEEVLLSDDVFAEQPPPSWGMAIYSRVENVPFLQIDEAFFLKWINYSSSALDIWHTGQVVFPQRIPPHKDSNGNGNKFAGLALANCSTSELPLGIFGNKESVGLNLILHSSIMKLNLLKLLSGTQSLKYLTVSQCVVGSLEGSPTGAPVTVGGTQSVVIKESTVGIMESGALSFASKDGSTDVIIKDTNIGIAKNGSMAVSMRETLTMERCHVGLIESGAISLKPYSHVYISNSTLISEPDSLSHLSCDDGHSLNGNIMLPLLPHPLKHKCISDSLLGRINHTSTCLSAVSFDKVLHPSCAGNLVAYGAVGAPLHAVEAALPPTVSENDTQNLLPNNSEHVMVPLGVAYFGAGVVVFVVIVIIVLLALITFRKKAKPATAVANPVRMTGISDSLYEEQFYSTSVPPPVYFARSPSPTTPCILKYAQAGKFSEEDLQDEKAHSYCNSATLPKSVDNDHIFMK